MTEIHSYTKDGVIIRPVAADFMKMELELELELELEALEKEEDDENEELANRGVVYEVQEEPPISDEERQSMRRRTDIDNLRKFLEGKYVFEEGETLAAFDEVECEYTCMSVFGYIQSLEDYHDVFNNWTLDDASLWVLDIADWHFGVLNAAEIFAVVNMMMEDMCRRNSF
jgi:hypothetical protein